MCFLVTDGNISSAKVVIVAMTTCMNYFGISDLHEILDLITQNSSVTVSECRPSKVRHYIQVCTVKPRYNAVVRVHDFGPRCKQGALGVPISATRGLLNNAISVPGTKNTVEATVRYPRSLYAVNVAC